MSKGPYRASEGFSGSKAMTRSGGALKSAQGKMSSAHGVVPKNTHNNMTQNASGAVGSCCPTFSKSSYRQAGPKNFGHAKQPSGHKDKA